MTGRRHLRDSLLTGLLMTARRGLRDESPCKTRNYGTGALTGRASLLTGRAFHGTLNYEAAYGTRAGSETTVWREALVVRFCQFVRLLVEIPFHVGREGDRVQPLRCSRSIAPSGRLPRAVCT